MAIRPLIILIVGFSVLWSFGYSSNIQCDYRTTSAFSVDSVYYCQLQNNINITSKESRVISSNSGSHDSGKSNADVRCFYTNDASNTVRYFPRNLENVFENLKVIWIRYGRLQEIQQSDLRPFSKLVRLNLYENDIEFLDDGLFAYNPELELIDFGSNKIIHIGSQVFDHLNKLNYLYLGSNKCINMNAENNSSALREVISNAKAKCFGYSEIDKELRTLETSLLCVNSETFPIFDENLQNLQNQFQKSKFSNSSSLKERFQKITNWKSKNMWTVKDSVSTIITSVTNSKSEVLRSLKTDLTAIENTQTSTDSKVSNLNKLTNSQAQTCSAISNNVANVSNYLISMNQELQKKSDNTDIINSISNLATKLSNIGIEMNAKFSNLNSYVGKIEQEVKQLNAKTASNSGNDDEGKVLQQAQMETATNTKITSLEEKMSNLTSMLQDFIQLSAESSNKIAKTSIIHNYSKSIMIGCCGLLNIILIIIIYREMFSQPDE